MCSNVVTDPRPWLRSASSRTCRQGTTIIDGKWASPWERVAIHRAAAAGGTKALTQKIQLLSCWSPDSVSTTMLEMHFAYKSVCVAGIEAQTPSSTGCTAMAARPSKSGGSIRSRAYATAVVNAMAAAASRYPRYAGNLHVGE